MKVKVLVDVLFEYTGMKKTLWKAGTVLSANPSYKWETVGNPKCGCRSSQESKELDGYWITNGERTPHVSGSENPGSLYETKCFLNECEVIEE